MALFDLTDFEWSDSAGARRSGEVLTTNEFMDAAWPGMAIEESKPSVQIAHLQKALGPAPGGEWIETIPRIGYRFLPWSGAPRPAWRSWGSVQGCTG
jgi:hypothetical protein